MGHPSFSCLKILLDFHKPIDHEDDTITSPEGMTNADFCKPEDCAAMLDVSMANGTSGIEKVSCLWHGHGQPANVYILKLDLLGIQQTFRLAQHARKGSTSWG